MKKYGPKRILEHFNSSSVDLMNAWESVKKIEEVKDLHSFASGVSTIVFHAQDKNKVICLSVDYAKVLYLKEIKELVGFKFIRFADYEFCGKVEFALIYEMDLMSEITYEEGLFVADIDQEDIDGIESLLEDSDFLIDFNSIYKISNKKHLPDCKFDIHPGQFLVDKITKSTICIDPILSKNVYI